MGILRCYRGVGVGHTREIERNKEKMKIAKEGRKHGNRDREGTVYQNMTERQQKQEERDTHTG